MMGKQGKSRWEKDFARIFIGAQSMGKISL
jgi:hypothetical protein